MDRQNRSPGWYSDQAGGQRWYWDGARWSPVVGIFCRRPELYRSIGRAETRSCSQWQGVCESDFRIGPVGDAVVIAAVALSALGWSPVTLLIPVTYWATLSGDLGNRWRVTLDDSRLPADSEDQ